MGSEDVSPRQLYLLRPTLGQGGADRVTLTLLESLDPARFRTTLVLMHAEGEWLSRVPASTAVVGLGGGRLWTAWWPLLGLLRRRPPALLFSTSSGTNLIACLARWLQPRARYRLALSERSALRRPPGMSPRHRLIQLAKRLLYPRADLVTAVSEGVAEDLRTLLRLPAAKVRVVANPIVTPELAALAAQRPAHPWLESPQPVILAAGRLQPQKAFDVLLDAFARLEHRGCRLIILGEGPLRAALEARARRLGIERRVALPGFEPNPFAYMARSTLFVLSSRHEGSPGVLIQAMACGAPVVATNCHAGPAEIVDHGVTGLLAAVDDPDGLAECIDRLLGHPEERGRIAAAGRAAVSRFGVDAAIRSYTGPLLELLEAEQAGETRRR